MSVTMRTERIGKAYIDSILVMRGDYPYLINPICDGIPLLTKELMDEVVDNLTEMIDVDFDYVIAPEAMGIHIATAYMLRTGKPFMVIRKREYGLPGEICIEKSTGYEKVVRTYINCVKKGDRIVIIDDIISTAGTLIPIVKALKEIGADVRMVAVILNKSSDLKAIEDKLEVPVRRMLDVGVEDGRPVIKQ